MYTIILFYKYIEIHDPHELRAQQLRLCKRYGLTGRYLIAPEGINATLEGPTQSIKKFLNLFQADDRFFDVDIKTSPGDGQAFPRLSIKVRDEIVASNLPKEIDPTRDTGTHISPHELKSWINEGKDFTIIDMRNSYEYQVGRFKGSIDPGMENFRDLPKVVHKLEHLKDKVVLPVCTGGVRCEKASAYLKSQGFKHVYQLQGGMHRYMEAYPGEDFEGTLYVFDNRTVWQNAEADKRAVVGKCFNCREQTEDFIDCGNDNCNAHLLACAACQQSHRAGDRVFCSGECMVKERELVV